MTRCALPPVGAGEYPVAVPEDLEARRLLSQCRFHRVGDGRLVARFALDVDEGGGQFDGFGGEVECGAHGPNGSGVSTSSTGMGQAGGAVSSAAPKETLNFTHHRNTAG